jgi:hypothetical protein
VTTDEWSGASGRAVVGVALAIAMVLRSSRRCRRDAWPIPLLESGRHSNSVWIPMPFLFLELFSFDRR